MNKLIKTNKFQFIKDYIVENNIKTILDVGCRDCILKKYVGDVVDDYKGCDLFQNEDDTVDYILNIEEGLPFKDNSFDCVVALDLVEHLNGFEEGVIELLKVAKKDLILMLPNMSHFYFRLRFLLLGNISGKYSLDSATANKNSDRHRWVTVLKETNTYMDNFCRKNGLRLEIYDYIGPGPKMKSFASLGRFFHMPKSLYVWSTIYVIKKI